MLGCASARTGAALLVAAQSDRHTGRTRGRPAPRCASCSAHWLPVGVAAPAPSARALPATHWEPRIAIAVLVLPRARTHTHSRSTRQFPFSTPSQPSSPSPCRPSQARPPSAWPCHPGTRSGSQGAVPCTPATAPAPARQARAVRPPVLARPAAGSSRCGCTLACSPLHATMRAAGAQCARLGREHTPPSVLLPARRPAPARGPALARGDQWRGRGAPARPRGPPGRAGMQKRGGRPTLRCHAGGRAPSPPPAAPAPPRPRP